MAGIVEKAVGISVGLLLLFVFATSLILPQFSNSWRYCQARTWNSDVGGAQGANCTIPYTNANTTPVLNVSTHTEEGLTSDVNVDNDPAYDIDSYCLNCDTAGGYRATNQGLNLLILTLALVGFALLFIPRWKL